MNIHIKTAAQDCHITVNIRIGSNTLLSLTDNDEEFMELLPTIEYTFEWHVFTGPKPAHASIQAEVSPANAGFLPLNIQKDYPAGVQDGSLFLFTLV